MLPKLLNILFILLLATTIRIDARRSRIDLPISNAAEAPVMDNVATASGNESQEMKVPAPAVVIAEHTAAAATADESQMPAAAAITQSDLPAPISSAGSSSDDDGDSGEAQIMQADSEEECDPDMIGFEIVTG